MVVVNLVYGLTLPLLSLILDARGVSKTAIGLSIVAQASGGVVLAPLVPRWIIRFGAARLMQIATVLAAVSLLALGLTDDWLLWLGLRFVLGAAAAALWSASETVINQLAREQWRGRIIGVYSAAGAAGFAAGPLILVATGSSGLLPFLVTSACILAAGIPLLWLRDISQVPGSDKHSGLWRIFCLVPHIMLLNLVYAAAVEAYIAFFPLFGLHVGIGEARSLVLLTIFAVGGMCLQLPLGWLADHMSRYRLLLGCIVLTALGFAGLPTVLHHPVASIMYSFLLGGVEAMIYALGIVLLGQRFRGAELATASVLYTGMWGIGTMLGLAMVGTGMDLLGNASMTWLIAALYVAYLPVLLFRRDRSVS